MTKIGQTHLEKDLENFFWDHVRRAGGVPLKLAAIQAGTPDRLAVIGGRVHLVELKADSGDIRLIQKAWHAALLRRTGVHVHVLRGRSEVKQWVRWNLDFAAGDTELDWFTWKIEDKRARAKELALEAAAAAASR